METAQTSRSVESWLPEGKLEAGAKRASCTQSWFNIDQMFDYILRDGYNRHNHHA
jgi:hypothetical protein